ncbi:FkbM family methyltransferase [Neotamlana laminarinivorans]|uniref:FkbM family methyltransferase n=1 Tax=Neotamlana laminarinivorans TaxID=2883124 RepID=A0A9X1HZT9_9FLAO|nr:FkbM family methyltransferase [Tamlana laminarinivorans]MCB4799193.1 FkbM family methyltransferase [Tamlana laminarinivorans]
MILQIIYKLIYQKHINYVLRNINYVINPFIPKKIKIPPSGILNLKTDSGIIKIATNQTSYLTQLLFWKGYKYFEYSEIFEKLCKQTTNFLDIGSNIGYYSLIAAKANPEIKIYAFEPALGPKHFLKKNILINNFESIISPINLALSDNSGTIDFYEVKSKKYTYLEHDLAGEGNAGTKTSSRNFIKNTVTATTLSEFVTQNKLSKIDLIKMDTEGTEITILKASKETIAKHEPIVICETLYNTIENELDDFFNSLNYLFFNHTKQGLKEVKTITRSKDNGIRNCFFVPKSKLNLIETFITD